MGNLKYFPFYMDRWIAGTVGMTFEERGFYISVLAWMYSTGEPVKDADHAARILNCDPRTSRRLWPKLQPKFRRTSAGDRHKLVDEILKNGGKTRGLRVNNLPLDQDLDLDLEEEKNPPLTPPPPKPNLNPRKKPNERHRRLRRLLYFLTAFVGSPGMPT